VSHSPTETATEYELLKYDRGWAALNRLLRAGASFSGRERDCCYLNLGGSVGLAGGTAQFANVSAATGLDLPGDGRALALADWDFDGDEDFWITSRTGPRVRFFRNDVANGNRYLALRLVGQTCNRDAIGARVEVYLKSDTGIASGTPSDTGIASGTRPPLIKTLSAGHGYLAQSSKWLNFGLGADGTVERIVVRWPDGKTSDTYRQIEPNRRYELRQGSAEARPWQPPREPILLAAKTAEEPKLTDQARVVVLRPPQLPRIEYVDASGQKRALAAPGEGPRLVNVWATWCQPCLAELNGWGREQAKFSEAGVRVLALCVDPPTKDAAADRQRASAVVEKLGERFSLGWPAEATVEMLDVLQRTFVGRQRPMPVPASFLLDAQGRLSVIYRGPVSAEQLVRDVKLLEQPLDRVREGAVPFPGRWYSATEPTAPAAIAGELIDGGHLLAAKEYLGQLIATGENELKGIDDPRRAAALKSQLAAAHETIGRIAYDEKNYEQAVAAYRQAIELAPDSRGAHLELARTYTILKAPEKVAFHLEAVLKVRPEDPENLRRLAMLKAELRQWGEAVSLMRQVLALKPSSREHAVLARVHYAAGDFTQAVFEFRRALDLEPGLAAAANDLAWTLATCPDAKVRNGRQAVELAEKLCPADAQVPVEYLDTLAAAYAEVGRFGDAQKAASKAIARVDRAKNGAFFAELTARERLYKSARPYRTPGG
jgi:tetratricopeptide (TPR) repeat protein